mgnify:CR=1 FL=1
MSYLDKSLKQIHEALKSGEITSKELVEESLKRANDNQQELNSFVTIIDDVKEAEINDSILSGIPYAAKDNLSTKNILTTASSNILSNYVPVFDATCIKKQKDANAVLIGKTVMDELGMGGTNLNAYTGKVNNKEFLLVRAGVGKVNAARTTQILIDNFNVNGIINVGSAGSSNDNLEIGDIVIGKKLIQHDFDITAFGHPKGYISNVGQFVESDQSLIEKMEYTISKIEDKTFKIKIGNIASGDIFCTEIKMKEKIREKFDADAIEMEGAAIAQVCKLDDMPFIIIRSISDTPNGDNNITFEAFLEKASKRCAKIIKEFLN